MAEADRHFLSGVDNFFVVRDPLEIEIVLKAGLRSYAAINTKAKGEICYAKRGLL
jgi:hypothetical protein